MSRFVVPEKVIQMADRCGYGHSCVDTGQCGTRALCKVERALNQQISFLETEASETCNCRINFGGRELCMCPVRAYIFAHYGE